MTTVLIIEDHPLFLNALAHLTRSVLGVEPLLANSAEAGLQVIGENLDPDLIIMDMGLPGQLKGRDAVLAVRSACPGVPLLVVSGSEGLANMNDALGAGADGYASKTSSTTELADAIRRAAARSADPAPPRLTDRQREILRLLCNGLSNKEIGRHLGLSDATVKMHMTAVLRSLGVATRTQAVLMARDLGLDMLP